MPPARGERRLEFCEGVVPAAGDGWNFARASCPRRETAVILRGRRARGGRRPEFCEGVVPAAGDGRNFARASCPRRKTNRTLSGRRARGERRPSGYCPAVRIRRFHPLCIRGGTIVPLTNP